MGMRRNAEVEAWQPPANKHALRRLCELGGELIPIVTLERSGIRDGDGLWSGACPLDRVVREIFEQYRSYYGEIAFDPTPERTADPGDASDLPF